MFSALPTSSQGRSLLVLRSPLAESDLSYLSFEVTVLSEVYEVRVDKPQKSGTDKAGGQVILSKSTAASQLPPNQAVELTLDCFFPALPLRSVASKRSSP